MSKTKEKQNVTRLSSDMVLVELPHRELLEQVALHEGYDSVEEWLDYAILRYAHFVTVWDKMEPIATQIAVKLLERRAA